MYSCKQGLIEYFCPSPRFLFPEQYYLSGACKTKTKQMAPLHKNWLDQEGWAQASSVCSNTQQWQEQWQSQKLSPCTFAWAFKVASFICSLPLTLSSLLHWCHLRENLFAETGPFTHITKSTIAAPSSFGNCEWTVHDSVPVRTPRTMKAQKGTDNS